MHRYLLSAVLLLGTAASLAPAWWVKGHETITEAAAMRLHATRSYDGRKWPDGKFAQRGIHAKIDAFPEKNQFTAEEVCRGLEPKAIEDVWAHTLGTIKGSFDHIDRCYELDAKGE